MEREHIADAKAIYQRVLNDVEVTESLETLAWASELAEICFMLDDLDEGARWLKFVESNLGKLTEQGTTVSLLRSAHALRCAFAGAGDPTKKFREAVDLIVGHSADELSQLTFAAEALAEHLDEHSDLAAAVAVRERLYARLREVDGPQSPTLISVGASLGADLVRMGRFEEAREVLERTLELAGDSRLISELELASLLVNRAVVEIEHDVESALAENLLHEALTLVLLECPEDAHEVTLVRAHLARLYSLRGDEHRADVVLEE